MAQSIVDTWMEEWLQQGVQQGVRQEQDLVARKLLERHLLSPEEIASLLEMETDRVIEIARNLGRSS